MAIACNDGGQKMLSLVVMGRNDEYMGNFKYRITTCLNYLARHLTDLGRLDDVEVLVTDWGSMVPLAKVLPLSPEAEYICRFVYVPPSIISTVRPDGDFAPYWAANVGLRRGKGEFCLLFDADSLFPRQSLQTLFNLLDGKIVLPFDVNRIFFFLCRSQVPWEVVQRQPTLEEWDRYLFITAGSLPPDQGVGLGIAGSGQMMHRSMWHECRGYNQQLIGQAWGDAELTLRVTQCYPWMNLSGIGISAFHMMHWPHNRLGVWHNSVINPYIVSPAMQVNDENWGLGNYQLDMQVAENIIESPQTTELLEAVNPIELWGQTKNELVSELSSHSVREHVQCSLQGWSFDAVEWESLCALSWYSLYHYPRTYIDFGIKKGCAAAVVAAACPGVEIYGIDRWEGSGRGSAPQPSNAAGILQRVGYRGYMRFVSGEPKTALCRLRDSFIGRFSFDLALVRGDMFDTEAIQQLSDLIPHLASGGMLVFTCVSTVVFQRVWKEMQDKFSEYVYLLCHSGRTGLILAVSFQNDNSNISPTGGNGLRVNFGRPPRFCLAQQLVHRGFHAMRNPGRYPEYARRIWRRLKKNAR